MIDLERFAESPLDDEDISQEELIAFGTDSQERMSANNTDGFLTVAIAATAAAMQEFVDATTDDLTQLGLRKSAKTVKNNFRETLSFEAGKVVSLVEGKFGKGTPQVQQCIPQGRKVFADSRDDKVQDHLDTLVTAVTALQTDLAELGTLTLNLATTLRDSWVTIYTASEAATGAKTATEEEIRKSRAKLQWQLYLNLQDVTRKYPRQREKIRLYFRQDLLKNPSSGPAPQPSASSTSSSSVGSSSLSSSSSSSSSV